MQIYFGINQIPFVLISLFILNLQLCSNNSILLQIYYDIDKFNAKNSIVTIGIFDGVHRGHMHIIDRLNDMACQLNGETVVVTLWPHPKMVLGNNSEKLNFLTTQQEKIELIKKSGIDHLIILPFTHEFAETSFSEFIEKYLVKKIKTKYIVIGHNHHFGKGRKGGFEDLKLNSLKFGFTVEKLMPVIIDNRKVSSSEVRKQIVKGNISNANKLLGYEYFLNGKVIEGKKFGRKLGFPTANIHIKDENKLIPLTGVYAVWAEIENKKWPAMANIGVRPTIAEQSHNITVEAHIHDFDDNIYNKEIKIIFVERIRNEKKFENITALSEQLKSDQLKSKKILGEKTT